MGRRCSPHRRRRQRVAPTSRGLLFSPQCRVCGLGNECRYGSSETERMRRWHHDGGRHRAPVREWLKGLPGGVRKEIGSDIQVVQWRWPLGGPLVDGFGDGLFEVRTGHDGNIYRVIFCLEGSIMVLLDGFTKKSPKTPEQDIEMAKKRQREEKEPGRRSSFSKSSGKPRRLAFSHRRSFSLPRSSGRCSGGSQPRPTSPGR